MVQNRKYLAVFKNAGAVGKDNAKTLDELGIEENVVDTPLSDNAQIILV